MSPLRNRSWLLAWALVCLAGGPALAQGLRDAQLFASAEMDQFGGGPRANEGLFIQYDGLYWTVSAPDVTTFGVPPGEAAARPVWWGAGTDATTTQSSTFDTSFLKNAWAGGQRIAVGNINDHKGWMIEYLNVTRSSQFLVKQGVEVYYDDRIWGAGGNRHLQGYTAPLDPTDPNSLPDPTSIRDLGVQYDSVTLRNRIKTWSVEADIIVRTHPMPRGGMFEWLLGARFMEINEQFNAEATGGLLDATYLSAFGDNRLVGPHLGLRWFTTNDRWTFSTQGSFVGAVNMQSARLMGVVGSGLSTLPPFPRFPADWTTDPLLPLAMTPADVNRVAHFQEFSPVVELRVEASYRMTRAVSIHGGWTGMWIDNLARPSGMINYELGETTNLGILNRKNRQDLFMNGLVLGVQINR